MALHRFECVDASLVFTKFCFNFKKSSIYLQVIFLLWGRKLFHFFSSECLGQGFLVFLPRRLFQISATAMHPLRSSKCSSNTEKKTQTKNQINKQKKTQHHLIYIFIHMCIHMYFMYILNIFTQEWKGNCVVFWIHGTKWDELANSGSFLWFHIVEFPRCLFYNLLHFFL